MRARLVLLGALLAGCLGADEAPTPFPIPPPRVGDVVEYETTGPYADLVRWEPAISGPPRRVRLAVEEGPALRDAGLRAVETFAVRLEADAGGGWEAVDVRYVDRATLRVVQVLTPFNATERVVSWEEHGAPWAFGAGALLGREIPPEGLDLAAPAAAGQPAALPLPVRVDGVGDTRRVTVDSLVRLAYDWRAGQAWPETFRVEVGPGAAGWVAAGFAPGTVFEGRKVAEARGAAALPAPAAAPDVPPPVAAPVPWTGRAPPERGETPLAFPLAEAMTAAETLDPGLRAFLEGAARASLYRATYYVAPAAPPLRPAAEPTWNLGYVSPDERYYEVKVARAAGTPLHRTYDSGAVPAPRGEHGWMDPATLPRELLALDDAVARFREIFAPDYEIFVRSFSGDARTPAGYYYLVDGGFAEPGGRYTTTWNAQTGRLESAVGPVEPR